MGVIFVRKIELMIIFMLFLLTPEISYSMHIMEGFLPLKWCVIWDLAALPFIIVGAMTIGKKLKENPKLKMLLGFAGAFAFVLSALKIPSVTGSCSHPTGVGLGAILFGPFTMSILGLIILLFQALLLAHGGITTLGANTFSMAIVGPIASYAIFKGIKKVGGPNWLAVFLSAFLGDLLTYVTTSFQLAIAFPAERGGFAVSFLKFMGIFAITQVPLAISEGLLTVLVINLLMEYSKEELIELDVL